MNRKQGKTGRTTVSGVMRLLRAIMTVMAVVVVLSCTAGDNPAYEVTDSGIWVAPNPITATFWLDNNRVFFNSHEKLVPDGGPERGVIWDTSTGKVTLSHPLGKWGGVLCVRDGKVLYFLRDRETHKVTHYFGSIENAPEYPPPGEDMRIDPLFDCDWVPRKTASSSGNCPYRYKLRGNNYMEVFKIGTSLSRGRMVYHEHSGDRGTEMPFDIAGGGTNHYITYNRFIDAYIARHPQVDPKARPGTDWKKRSYPRTDSYWIIERNGTLRRQFYPATMPGQTLSGFFPLREGYLVHGSGGKRITATDPGDGGLYLMRGESYERLIVGSIEGISVSPDGCKAAFSYARNVKEDLSRKRPYRTLKIINLCK
jgi:hypothetical protein